MGIQTEGLVGEFGKHNGHNIEAYTRSAAGQVEDAAALLVVSPFHFEY
jgi:hypothetical protein